MIQRFIQITMALFERTFPSLGGVLAFRFFFTPMRAPQRPIDAEFRAKGEESSIEINGKKTVVYSWGRGPVVLFAHGWSSKALHYRRYVDVLIQSGYKVVAPDFPGHGRSEGKRSSALEFRDTLLRIAEEEGPVYALVGHSLGALAAILMLYENTQTVERLVVMNSSTTADHIVKRFAQQTGAGPRTIRHFFKRTNAFLDTQFEDFRVSELYQDIQAKPRLLVVADDNDIEVPVAEAQELARTGRGDFILTEGLGHIGGMKDDALKDRIIDFIMA